MSSVALGRSKGRLAALLRVIVEAGVALAPVAIAGMIAIGASGLIAWAMGWALGRTFVSGDLPGVTYTPSRCAELSEYAPGAHSCAQAATFHHFDEIVFYRLAAGVIGLIALAAFLWLRHRIRLSATSLPDAFAATVATTAFGLATVALLADGADHFVQGFGAGASLSAAIVAGALTIAYGWSLLRTLAGRAGAAGSAASPDVPGPPGRPRGQADQ
jgi:hypothetical protein